MGTRWSRRTSFLYNRPANEKKHVVVAGKQRIVGVENVEDAEEYNQFDDVPPFWDPEKIKLVEATLDRSVMPYMRFDGVGNRGSHQIECIEKLLGLKEWAK